MQLTKLFHDTSLQSAIADRFSDREITGITADSRQVTAGMVFFALAGSQSDGNQFIEDAIQKGAVTVVTNQPHDQPDDTICYLQHDNPRLLLSEAAAQFYPQQPGAIVAVTGTNGKSSTVHFCYNLWQNLGLSAACLGTIGLEHHSSHSFSSIDGNLTTLDPVRLHSLVDEIAQAGITHLALEASSHGLDQHRLDNIQLQAAAFTNISKEHLDYHPSMEAYFNAKMHLFDRVLPAGNNAVINTDIPEFETIATVCKANNHQIISFGTTPASAQYSDAHIMIDNIQAQPNGLGVSFRFESDKADVLLPFAGDFQASNIAAALGLAIATGSKASELFSVLDKVTAPKGRMQLAGTHPNGANIYIDYAHTPDALEKALKALRPCTANKLWVLVGCGGDRDQTKRPLMGSIASSLADHVIVTDDNPRHEDPASIRQAILAACTPENKVTEIADRAIAISQTIDKLESGDSLLIAGKGHETYQIIGDRIIDFDDFAVTENEISRLNSSIGAQA